MKKIFYNVSIVILVLACLLGTLVGCERTSIDPQKYTSYCCYDYHLKCLAIEGKKAKTEISHSDDSTGVEYTQNAWMQKIVGESDDMFIYAEVIPSLSLGSSDKIIMQNPNHYVDVWNDWTVEKIELYYIDGHNPIEQDKPANIPTAIIATTQEGECLSNIKKLVESSDEWAKPNLPDGYVRENVDKNGTSYSYYIRVYFKESESIVWDSQVECYYSSENKDRIIYIDIGKKPDGIASVNAKYININCCACLLNWIVTSIDNN